MPGQTPSHPRPWEPDLNLNANRSLPLGCPTGALNSTQLQWTPLVPTTSTPSPISHIRDGSTMHPTVHNRLAFVLPSPQASPNTPYSCWPNCADFTPSYLSNLSPPPWTHLNHICSENWPLLAWVTWIIPQHTSLPSFLTQLPEWTPARQVR